MNKKLFLFLILTTIHFSSLLGQTTNNPNYKKYEIGFTSSDGPVSGLKIIMSEIRERVQEPCINVFLGERAQFETTAVITKEQVEEWVEQFGVNVSLFRVYSKDQAHSENLNSN